MVYIKSGMVYSVAATSSGIPTHQSLKVRERNAREAAFVYLRIVEGPLDPEALLEVRQSGAVVDARPINEWLALV